MVIDKKTSDCLFVIKAFAILSVVTAHMPFTSSFPLSENVRNTLGQIGVAIFFILSGFFFKREKGDSKRFWLKKAKTIVLPWVICGIGTFAFSIVLNRGKSNYFISAAEWILGVGTWYWYITVLLVLFALFKFLENDALLYIAIALTAVSVILSSFGKVPYNTVFNPYLNIFNWTGFFATGILINKHNILKKLINLPAAVISIAVLAFSAILTVRLPEVKAYINFYSILVEFSGFVLFLNISYLLSNVCLLQDIGKKSYLIYLIHMQIAGIINTRLPYNPLFFILRPIIALSVVYILVKMLELFLKKTGLIKYGYILALGK